MLLDRRDPRKDFRLAENSSQVIKKAQNGDFLAIGVACGHVLGDFVRRVNFFLVWTLLVLSDTDFLVFSILSFEKITC